MSHLTGECIDQSVMDYPAGTDDSQEQTTMRADLGRVTGHDEIMVWCGAEGQEWWPRKPSVKPWLTLVSLLA